MNDEPGFFASVLRDLATSTAVILAAWGALGGATNALTTRMRLRDALPDLRLEMNLGDGSFKAQLKRADRSGAAFAVILGETEVRDNRAALKPLRSTGDQVSVPFDSLASELAERITPTVARTGDLAESTDKRQ